MTEAFEVIGTIPVPTSVSPDAQQFLASGLALRNESGPSPAPDDLDGWRALIAMANAGLATMMEMRMVAIYTCSRIRSGKGWRR